MSVVPVARNRHASYENFTAECPFCGFKNVFNRASDLQTLEPIAGRDVACQSEECLKGFRIVGDQINEPHEMLIYDCDELVARKHYMNALLTIAQAYEVFFGLFFRVELLYLPFCAKPDQDREELNRLSEALQARIKDHTFAAMRALFLQHMVARLALSNLGEAATAIAAIPDRPGDPKDSAIESLSDTALVSLLKALKATNIHTLRNRVVHKQAYRPSHQEVEEALEESRSILFPLTGHLQLHDDINWYARNP
jgi:hypothetical protein